LAKAKLGRELAQQYKNTNMKDGTVDAELTADLRNFLERRGYSHIVSLGIEPKEQNDANEPETGKENYWLLPIKEGDERMKAENPRNLITAINDTEISEMAGNKNEIQFMIKVPIVDYNDYLAKR
jgi:hypothetical protein